VRQGQIVAVLDDRDLRARHEQAQALLSASQSAAVSAEAERESAAARLALARTNHERITQLRARNSATPQELDRATADLQMAEAAVRSAAARTVEGAASVRAAQSASLASEVAASFSSIIAPFDGLVTSRLLEPGNMAAPGVPLLTLETTDGFRLEAQVDEARARFFDIGDSAEILLDGTGEPDAMAGRVIEIGRAIDPAAHAFVVKVQIPAGAAVRSGMFARLRFTGAARDALVVPASAVVRRSQLSLVFVVDAASRARMRAITAGTQSGEAVEVLAGVQAGETIIAGPPAWLADGTVVRVTGQRP
jgi:RND family efflux transporter MFP subunit